MVLLHNFFCFNLRTATLIIAWFNIIGLLLALIAAGIQLFDFIVFYSDRLQHEDDRAFFYGMYTTLYNNNYFLSTPDDLFQFTIASIYSSYYCI